MVNNWSRNLFVFFTLLFLGCATQGKLTGGEKDEDPPKLKTEKSTPNFQTNYTPNEIVFVFDEFIKITNPLKETGISPPLKHLPQFESKGKKFVVKFSEDEVLKENATYTINFGKAIKDFREGNTLEDFSFVFATGDFLDSLEIHGKVRDAKTGEGVEDVVVMLYDILGDSAVIKEKPFYFDRTNKSGEYKIQNIKTDTFAIYALMDENLSYTWDLPSEAIGFLDSSFVLNDSSNSHLDLVISNPFLEPKLISTESYKDGVIKIAFDTPLEKKPNMLFSKPLDYISSFEKDSLFVWYDTTATGYFSMYSEGDTISIKPKKRKSTSIQKINSKTSKNNTSISPNDSLRLYFDRPILTIDTSKIIVMDTSNTPLIYQYEMIQDSLGISIRTKKKYDVKYSIQLLDSALVSFNRIYNDSIGLNFNYLDPEELGTIYFIKDSISTDSNFAFELMDGKKSLGVYTLTDLEEKLTIDFLSPKKYTLHIIDDRNANGIWDTGNFESRQQPEQIIVKELEKLRANWELEVILSKSVFNILDEHDTKGN